MQPPPPPDREVTNYWISRLFNYYARLCAGETGACVGLRHDAKIAIGMAARLGRLDRSFSCEWRAAPDFVDLWRGFEPDEYWCKSVGALCGFFAQLCTGGLSRREMHGHTIRLRTVDGAFIDDLARGLKETFKNLVLSGGY